MVSLTTKYLHKKYRYNVIIVLISYCKTLAAIELDTGKDRDRFGGMVRIKVGLNGVYSNL